MLLSAFLVKNVSLHLHKTCWLLYVGLALGNRLLARFISSIASIAKIIQEELCELKSSEGDKL